jgi:hypothetical protein
MNIVAFVGFSRIFFLGILICKGLTARRLYKSFSVKGLKKVTIYCIISVSISLRRELQGYNDKIQQNCFW